MAYYMKQAHLEVLVEEFNTWQKNSTDLSKENLRLQEQFNLLKKLQASGEERCGVIAKELEEQSSLVYGLQENLKRRFYIEEENSSLKAKLKEQEEAYNKTLQERERQWDDLQDCIESMKEEHKNELSSLKMQVIKEGDKKVSGLEVELQACRNEVSDLQKKIMELENEKQAEIIKLRLEYDQKFLKLQKQANKLTQQPASSTTNQEIYRKKLAHLKAESEREIAQLKKKIHELEQPQPMTYIAQPQGRVPPTQGHQPNQGYGHPVGRKRVYNWAK